MSPGNQLHDKFYMETATATAHDSLFQEVQSGVRRPTAHDGVNPTATRFAIVPIWDITGLPATAFKTHGLIGSKFYALRPFRIPITNAEGHQEERERQPLEQVGDLFVVAGDKFATDFPALAKLENETLAREIIGLLANPNKCEKYPLELGASCATCWVAYLRENASAVLAETYEDNPTLFEAAADTMQRLVTSFDNALAEAREQVNVALRDIDDTKSGKDRFFDVDYRNIWHTHQGMPQMKTSTNEAASLEGLTKALTQALAARDAGGLTLEDVKALIAEGNAVKDARIAELEAQLAGTTTCTGTKSNGDACKMNAVPGTDRCKFHKEGTNESEI